MDRIGKGNDVTVLPDPSHVLPRPRVVQVRLPRFHLRLMASLVDATQPEESPTHNDTGQDHSHATFRLPTSPRPPSLKLPLVDTDSVEPNHTLPNSRPSYFTSPSLSPAARTGPPRSLSFTYNHALPSSLSSRSYFHHHHNDAILEQPRRPRAFTHDGMRDHSPMYDLTPRETDFRGPFDIAPEQKDHEHEVADMRGKRKDSNLWDGFKSRWFPDARTGPPSEEPSGVDRGKDHHKIDVQSSGGPSSHEVSSPVASGSGLARMGSMSTQERARESERQDSHQTQGSKSPSTGWSRLRFLLPRVISSPAKPPPSTVTPGRVTITDELTVGGLSVIILRLWFDRDERGRRRVPILLHRLRIRISDSLHPLHGPHSVFRIECEYANGAIRWVIYRQLRDFLSLHAHCAVSNAYSRNIEKLPEFPRTSRFLGISASIYSV